MQINVDDDTSQRPLGFFNTINGRKVEIRDVWASNLLEEMAVIREVVEKFPYIAMV